MGHLPPTVPQDIDAMYGFVVLGMLQFYEVWKEIVQDEQRSVIFDCSSESNEITITILSAYHVIALVVILYYEGLLNLHDECRIYICVIFSIGFCGGRHPNQK